MGKKGKARAIAAKTHEYVNNKRQKNDLTALKGNSHLAAIAESYARTMAHKGRVGHDLDGRQPQQRAAYFHGVCENCIIVSGDNRSPASIAAEAANRWMNSPGHRENILRSQNTHSGVGVWLKSSDVYIVHKFASRRSVIQLGVEAARKVV